MYHKYTYFYVIVVYDYMSHIACMYQTFWKCKVCLRETNKPDPVSKVMCNQHIIVTVCYMGPECVDIHKIKDINVNTPSL